MKKKIILIIKIAVISLAVLSAIPNLCGRLILPANVLRVEFKGFTDRCSSPSIESKSIALSRSEIRELISRFNSSEYKGKMEADFCSWDFSFTVYMSNGAFITVKDGGGWMEVSSLFGSYWIESEALDEYAMELVEKHDLATRP